MKLLHFFFVVSALIGITGEAYALQFSQNDSTEAKATKRFPTALVMEGLQERPQRMVALKTNIVPWAATIMNIEGEIQIWRNLSVSVPLWYCPWFISERHALRVVAFQPEVRWWLNEPGQGHFGGLHGSFAWYNLRWGNYRYQDHGRPLLGAGITYGYAFTLKEKWGVELSIGAGYLNMRYDRFYNTENGERADTRKTSYFGLDHLSVSLVYHFSY